MADVVLTNAEVLVALRAFQTVGGKTIPNVKAAYALTKARRKLAEAAKDIDATRIQLCEQFAAKHEDGSAKHKLVRNDLGEEVDGFDLADEAGFVAAYNTLLALSSAVEGVRAVTVEELTGANFSTDELGALGPLVIE